MTCAPHSPAHPLPIDAAVPALAAALAANSSAVLVAPPGAGKTTRVPLALLDAPWLAGARIIVLEPRRLAARGAAQFMARQLGEAVGDTVGVRSRLGTKVGPSTRIEVVTEGVFTRLILADPTLEGIGAVLFDEIHERSLDADLGLALALDAQAGLRPDLRLLAMSATVDGARIASLMGNAAVIRCEGRAYPVETRYLPRRSELRLEDLMAATVERALADVTGSVLAFLPGQGEIRRVAERLAVRRLDQNVDVAALYAGLDLGEQDAALLPAPPGRRKVVLATSIAETSLTIEGITTVIDSGLARVPVYEPGSGITRLETVRVSRAAADQRRGRAGRLGPGVCYRLWTEPETQSLAPFAEPEIRNADLARLIVDCAAWGVTDPATLSWLDPPPAPALAAARAELVALCAVDGDGRLTALGEASARLPLPPRLAIMVLAAAAGGQAEEAARIAAVLVERGLGGFDPDLAVRLSAARADRSRRAEDMRRLARQWARLAEAGIREQPALAASGTGRGEQRTTAALLALAYPDRIAKARGGGGNHYLLANGRGAVLGDGEPLARAPFLVIAEVTGSAAAGRIRLAAEIGEAELATLAAGRIEETIETRFDPAAGAVRRRRTRRLGAIVLSSDPRPVTPDAETSGLLCTGLVARGIDHLPWSKGQVQLRERVGFLRKASGDAWPDLSDGALAATAEEWLLPFLAGLTAASEVTADLLGAALDAKLGRDLRQRLEREAPSHFAAPTGNRHAIEYGGALAPSVSIRVQELFGLATHPTVADGRIPLTLELLSPAHRPIQVTSDLPGFWRGSWADTRADMRGRYPKHEWPLDPANAAPTARAKPRARN